jgi:hypothetical protein
VGEGEEDLIPDWALRIALAVVGFVAGGVWFLVARREFHTALWVGFGGAVLFLLIVALHVRNDLIRRQATAAQVPASTPSETELAQRAHLVLEFAPTVTPSAGNMVYAKGTFKVTNMGQTAADQLYFVRSSGVSRHLPEPYEVIPNPKSAGPSLASGQSREYPISFGVGHWDEILRREMFFIIQVSVSYRDVFGKPRVVQGCYYYESSSMVRKFIACPFPQPGSYSGEDRKYLKPSGP